MLPFLGMAQFRRPWVCDFALVVQPLQDLIKAVDQMQVNAPQIWIPEALAAFESIKVTLGSVLALASPYYGKPFHQYMSEVDLHQQY